MSSHQLECDKQSTSVFIPKIQLNGSLQEIQLTAYTPGGNATVVTLVNKVVIVSEMYQLVRVILVIGIPLLCIILTVLTFIFICNRRDKVRRYQERCKYFEELEKKAPVDPKSTFELCVNDLTTLSYKEHHLNTLQLDLEEKIFVNDSMEIDRKDVTLYEILGEGAFGLVRRGIFNNNENGQCEVAVKMLKDNPTIEDIHAFRREIDVMKSVEKHSNIVGLIGHCTKMYNEMLLLTEYCSLGNLLDFLRNEWKYLHQMNINTINTGNHDCDMSTDESDSNSRTMHMSTSVSMGMNMDMESDKGNDRNTGMGVKMNLIKRNEVQSECKQQKEKECKMDTINEKLNMKEINKDKRDDVNSKLKSLFNNKLREINIEHVPLPTKQNSQVEILTEMNESLQPDDNCEFTKDSNERNRLVNVITAADNKSYGYPEFCTNSCKCHVNVIIEDIHPIVGHIETEKLDIVLQDHQHQYQQQQQQQLQKQNNENQQIQLKTIEINNCECHRRSKVIDTDLYELKSMETIIQATATAAAAATKKPHTRTTMLTNPITRSFENKTYLHYLMNSKDTTNNKHLQSKQFRNVKSMNDNNKDADADTDVLRDLKNVSQRVPLKANDLLDIAKQVAVGMEFLAKNKVVHRDLAARNVLVSLDRTVKIADFGLSRDIYQENIYKKTGSGKLPIKWLALESMTHQVYTTQSDVWSYGILLYEIATLGGTPYPSIPTNRLLHLLKTGYRMEKPKNCGQDFYNLMYSCWHINPNERPTFTDIINILDNMLMTEPEKYIENLFCSLDSADKSSEDTCSEGVSYLKPL